MNVKKQPAKPKKNEAPEKPSLAELRKKHPYETDSQIQNRYGSGRGKAGSDGSYQDSSGNNH